MPVDNAEVYELAVLPVDDAEIELSDVVVIADPADELESSDELDDERSMNAGLGGDKADNADSPSSSNCSSRLDVSASEDRRFCSSTGEGDRPRRDRQVLPEAEADTDGDSE